MPPTVGVIRWLIGVLLVVSGMAQGVAADSSRGDTSVTPRWQVPTHWVLTPTTKPLRHSTWLVPLSRVGDGAAGNAGKTSTTTLEVALATFPGEPGGLVANVNRWRSQVGLGPANERELANEVTRFTTTGMTGYVVHLTHAGRGLLGGAVYDSAAAQVWFIKASGTSAETSMLAPDFTAFVRSFQVATNTP